MTSLQPFALPGTTPTSLAPAIITHLIPQSYTETWGGRMLRDMDESVERSMRRALSSEVITPMQREKTWAAFFQATWAQRMAWSNRVGSYVQDVLSGRCQARADKQPEPVMVPVMELMAHEEYEMEPEMAHEMAHEIAQHADEVERVMEQVSVAVVRQLEQAEQQPVPMWMGTDERERLPAGLSWSGQQLPAKGTSVLVMRRGRARQAKVVGYFHAEGFLGVIADFEGRVPSVLRTSPRSQCFFGTEVQFIAA